MDIDLRSLLVRTVGTSIKLGVCAVAPLASSKIFYNPNSNAYADVIREFSGASTPKMAAFIGCAVNILSRDFEDAAEWVISQNLIEKAANYFSATSVSNEDEVKVTPSQLSLNDTYFDESLMCQHYHNVLGESYAYDV